MRRRGGWLCLLPFLAAAPAGLAAGVPEAVPAAYTHLAAEDIAVAAAAVQDALEQALSLQSWRWRSGSSGASGVITPLRTFRVADGRYCRDFFEVVVASGRPPASRKSTACRSPAGLWEAVAP
jgi:surface antigen